MQTTIPVVQYQSSANSKPHSLPENVSYAEGALLEPLSVVIHGIRSAGLSLGRGVAICGAGPIELIALQLPVPQVPIHW